MFVVHAALSLSRKQHISLVLQLRSHQLPQRKMDEGKQIFQSHPMFAMDFIKAQLIISFHPSSHRVSNGVIKYLGFKKYIPFKWSPFSM